MYYTFYYFYDMPLIVRLCKYCLYVILFLVFLYESDKRKRCNYALGVLNHNTQINYPTNK